MTSPRSSFQPLYDIIVWSERLLRHTEALDEEGFLLNEMAQDSISRCFEVIGEAANLLRRAMPDVEERFPKLELRQAYSIRNRIIHAYIGVDYRILWNTAQQSVPPLLAEARRVFALLESETSGSSL